MKKFIVFLLIAFLVKFVDAQDIQLAETGDYKRFVNSTTYVVKIPDPFSIYNGVIEEILAKMWTITDYEIIEWTEFEQKKSDSKSSFIFLSEAQRVENNKVLRYNILNLVMGSKYNDINKMPDLGSVPLSYADDEFSEEEQSYVYKLAGVLQFMQYYVNYQIANPGTKLQDVVNKEKEELHKKELWLVEDDLESSINSLSKIKKYYKHDVKIVSREDVENAIFENNPTVAYLHLVAPKSNTDKSKCWKFILSAEDGKPLFYSYTKTNDNNPGKLLGKDLKKMN
jgi:hypothetical protein